MSYILEALKKLEQKHQQAGTPNLLTLQGETKKFTKKRSAWPYVVSGIVILNGVIGLLLFWIAPWKIAMKVPPHKAQIEASESATTPQQTITLPGKKEEPPSEFNKEFPAKTFAPAHEKVVPEVASPSAAPLPLRPAQIANDSLTRTTKPVILSSKVVRIKELPSAIKSSLPELKMTVHVYNEQPQSRFTVINNNTIREGQFINAELKVEQIAQNGVVFSYRGHKFILGINENP